MNPASDDYMDVVQVYIRIIKRDSLAAGTVLEQIHFTFGAHAALRGAMVILLLKMGVKENYQVPDLSLYDAVTKDYPEALPLLRHAVACCRLAWGMSDPPIIYPQPDETLSVDATASETDNF